MGSSSVSLWSALCRSSSSFATAASYRAMSKILARRTAAASLSVSPCTGPVLFFAIAKEEGEKEENGDVDDETKEDEGASSTPLPLPLPVFSFVVVLVFVGATDQLLLGRTCR